MDRHTAHHDTSRSFIEAQQNESETECELMESIQRQLIIRFLKTNALERVHDQSLIQFVSDTIDPHIFQDDAEYRLWLQSQGIDADNLHALTSKGQAVLQTIINQWVVEQQTNQR
jgi:hypothetical protein